MVPGAAHGPHRAAPSPQDLLPLRGAEQRQVRDRRLRRGDGRLQQGRELAGQPPRRPRLEQIELVVPEDVQGLTLGVVVRTGQSDQGRLTWIRGATTSSTSQRLERIWTNSPTSGARWGNRRVEAGLVVAVFVKVSSGEPERAPLGPWIAEPGSADARFQAVSPFILARNRRPDPLPLIPHGCKCVEKSRF